MKVLVFAGLLLLLGSVPLAAQTEAIDELTDEIYTLKGKAFAVQAIALADAYAEAGYWKASQNWAVQAYKKAVEVESDLLMARAINREVKAILAQDDIRTITKARSVRKLERSNEWVPNDSLKLANLYVIRPFVQQRGRSKEILELEQKIALLEGDSERLQDLASNPEVLSKRKLAREVISNVAEENKDLNDQLEAIEAERKELALAQAALEEELVNRELAIENMSEDQVRAELMLAEQQSILDSLAYRSSLDSLRLGQQEMALKQQQLELSEQRTQRNFLLALAGIVVLLAAGIFLRFRETKIYNQALKEKNELIEREKERSEDLLLNILPQQIARELKSTGKAQARYYEQASVLFTDFVGFTKIAGTLEPQQIVEALDKCFRAFDRIALSHGLEKIKTIGDAYMLAGGLPEWDEGHSEKLVLAALEMQAFLEAWNKDRDQQGLPRFEARMGIHSGPLIAGVVGLRKFAYDIWGDTVNIAARMESTGEAGKINISQATRDLLGGPFIFTPRGEVEVKNVGKMPMYFVEAKA